MPAAIRFAGIAAAASRRPPADSGRPWVSRPSRGPGTASAELYRAFDHDAEVNKAALARDGKLTMPVLATGGAGHDYAAMAGDMMREHADDVTHTIVPDAGHWVAEENPGFFVSMLLDFDRAARN